MPPPPPRVTRWGSETSRAGGPGGRISAGRGRCGLLRSGCPSRRACSSCLVAHPLSPEEGVWERGYTVPDWKPGSHPPKEGGCTVHTRCGTFWNTSQAVPSHTLCRGDASGGRDSLFPEEPCRRMSIGRRPHSRLCLRRGSERMSCGFVPRTRTRGTKASCNTPAIRVALDMFHDS